jgi:hypothetical protein
MVSAKKKSKLKRRSEKSSNIAVSKRHGFAVCISGTGFDLIANKAYRILHDRAAEQLGCVRVIDESGEDYLYPASWFVPVRPQKNLERRLATALSNTRSANPR